MAEIGEYRQHYENLLLYPAPTNRRFQALYTKSCLEILSYNHDCLSNAINWLIELYKAEEQLTQKNPADYLVRFFPGLDVTVSLLELNTCYNTTEDETECTDIYECVKLLHDSLLSHYIQSNSTSLIPQILSFYDGLERKLDHGSIEWQQHTGFLFKAVASELPFSIFEELLDLGANINVAAHEGIKPIHLVCMFGRADLYNLFLRYGADPNALTEKGTNCKQIARKFKRQEILDLMFVLFIYDQNVYLLLI